MSTTLISNQQHYDHVISRIAEATRFVWIGTSDLKDLYVNHRGSTLPFQALLNCLLQRKVAVRLLHAKEPGKIFQDTFEKYPLLWRDLERQICPRVHFKIIIVDSKWAYTGSANLTGAGLGMKGINTRNFESGILTTNREMIEGIMTQFDDVWMGKFCATCKRKAYCHDPIA